MVRRAWCCGLSLGLALAGLGLAPVVVGLLHAKEDLVVPDVADEGELRGNLVICGGGRLPDEILQEFVRLAGGPQARIVIVTTASVQPEFPAVEAKLAVWRRQQMASLDVLHTRSRDVADSPRFSEVLQRATGVWFIGGDQNLLTSTYLGTRTEQRLHDLLDRGGVIGGTSAGAAIMSRVMIRGGHRTPVLGTGFGFLPGAIVDQHFLTRRRQGRLQQALAARPGRVGFGIDEGTALVVQGHDLRVIGDSQVLAMLPAEPQQARLRVLRAGDTLDLHALREKTPSREPVVASAASVE